VNYTINHTYTYKVHIISSITTYEVINNETYKGGKSGEKIVITNNYIIGGTYGEEG